MTATADLLVRLKITDNTTQVEQLRVDEVVDITALTANGKRETVTLANGFTALSPPSGAHGVIILPISGAFTQTLKGVTGDTGIPLGPAGTLPTLPVVMPLGTAPSVGIASTGAAVVEVIWF